jgi:beta-phosphoglucomutase-like phosphatase (HAD superfamily)
MLTILGVLTGLAGPIASFAKSITDLKAQREKAASDSERQKIDAEIREMEARKAAVIAEAGNRVAGAINATIRAALALGPVLYVLKYYAWDKVIGAFAGCANLPKGKPAPDKCATFVTDGLNVEMAGVLTAVIAFYLLYDLQARFRKR